MVNGKDMSLVSAIRYATKIDAGFAYTSDNECLAVLRIHAPGRIRTVILPTDYMQEKMAIFVSENMAKMLMSNVTVLEETVDEPADKSH